MSTTPTPVHAPDQPALVTEEEAARLLGLRPQTLSNWRCTHRVDLPFIRIGRTVRYRRTDLTKFIDTHAVTGGEK